MIVGLPSGIGDVSWAWSKLWNVKDQIEEIQIADGWPYRTVPFLKACGIKASYGSFDYRTILTFEDINQLNNCTWEKIVTSEKSTVLLEPNRHLEKGKRLEDWLPDLPIIYHYPLNVSQRAMDKAYSMLRNFKPPLVGISCASYRGSEAWMAWSRAHWVEFLMRVKAEGFTPILLGGFWDDLTHAVACELELPDLVGKTNIEEGIAVLTLLESYIGFSSGLGVIRTVLNKPVMMMWPDFQVELSRSWAPPEMIEEGSYTAVLWREVEDIWPVAKKFLTIR